jgi:hypothetical protein
MKTLTQGIALLITVLLLQCQDGPEEFLKKNANSLLRVKANATTLPADGKTSLLISAYIPGNSDIKNVKFIASQGKFRFSDSSTYTIEATAFKDSLRAQAYLVPGTETVDKVLVKVKIASLEKVLEVAFTNALADSIIIESPIASISRGFGSTVPVKTTLIRKDATPSQHQVVSFSAIRSDKKSIGEFRDVSPTGSDSNGLINSTFVLKDTIYTGPLKIITRYKGAKIYTDTLLIYITKK